MIPTRIAAALAVLLLAGCGGLVAFDVSTEPPGARVYVGLEQIGRTPTGVMTYRTSDPNVPLTIEIMNYKPFTFLVPSQVTYATEAEAKAHVATYRFNLKPRRP